MPAATELEARSWRAPRGRAARALACTVIAAELALAAPVRAADAPADRIADALVAEADARGASAGDAEVQKRLKLAFASSGRAAHGLALARFYSRSGRLLDALSVYRAVASQPKDAFRGAADADAAANARTELTALEARIPALRVRPSSGPATRVTVDGRDVVPNAWLSFEPGTHAVDASAPGFASRHVELTLAEGDRADTALDLVSLTASAPAAATPAAPAAAPTGAPGQFTLSTGPRRRRDAPESDPDAAQPLASPRGRSQRVLGWLMVGTGALGLIGGGVTQYLSKDKKHSDPDLSHTLGTVSTVSFAAGGGLAALGLIVVLTAPSPAPSASGAHERFSGVVFNGQF